MHDPVARLPGLLPLSIAIALVAGWAPAAPPDAWPAASRVESQPLLAQAARVEAALELLGSPLPAETRAALKKARETGGDEAVTAAVEAALDPFCVAAVRIAPDGGLSACAAKETPELIMEGWRTFLIKVLNEAGTDSMLQVESPNAGPVPNAPPGEVKKRWLDLHVYNSQPVLPALGGLALEYRVLELYSRDAGDLEAELRFRLGGPEKTAAGADPEKSARGRRIRLWGFDGGTEGWRAAREQTIEVREGVLWLKGAGSDQEGMDVDVAATGGGSFVLSLGAKVDRDSNVRVSWWTREKPGVDRRRQRSFQMSAEGTDFRERSARFDVEGDLAGLRVAPQSRRGTMQIDWISI
ncbi:MAG TPA: hypothetical protein VMT52_10385, partial [Planctomycetota bacterium]|nr:hypothetical protein [Planctomycetota bacterium]